MSLSRFAIIIGLATLWAGSGVAYASDPCATFFWTASRNAPVERYGPRYLIGQGLEDVHMDDIAGTRIRYKWSTQAASCIASSNHYGYFFHPDFNQTDCNSDETCFPGMRRKRLAERLADILSVEQALAIPNSDPTYQTNLNIARASTFLVIDSLGGPSLTLTFYGDMINEYDSFITQLDATLNGATPLAARTAVMDALCAPDNVARMEELEERNADTGELQQLTDLFNTIDFCTFYQSGGVFQDHLDIVASVRDGLVNERDQFVAARDQIQSLWNQIQDLRPTTLSVLPATCNVHFPFGTAQLPTSDFLAGNYGAEPRYLYGDWDWSNFGLSTTTSKLPVYVQGIAGLVHDCLGDARYGRLNFGRRRVDDGSGHLIEEPAAAYYTRVLTDLVALHAQLASISLNYATLVHAHAPLVPDTDIDGLKTVVSNTALQMQQFIANRATGLGWVVVLMQNLIDSVARFKDAQVAIRNLATVFAGQTPSQRDFVTDLLITNAQGVLDQYGDFFSEEKKSNLEELLFEAEAQGDDNADDYAIAINQIANDMQHEYDTLFSPGSPLSRMASQLKSIFNVCDTNASPNLLMTYFGDLPVTTRIIEDDSDVPFCTP